MYKGSAFDQCVMTHAECRQGQCRDPQKRFKFGLSQLTRHHNWWMLADDFLTVNGGDRQRFWGRHRIPILIISYHNLYSWSGFKYITSRRFH